MYTVYLLLLLLYDYLCLKKTGRGDCGNLQLTTDELNLKSVSLYIFNLIVVVPYNSICQYMDLF